MGNLIDVAIGTSRSQKVWKNGKIAWDDLVERFAKPVVTPEKIADYFSLPKAQQDSIKDVGGFVGGYLQEGRRTKVAHRQLLALDADYADKDLTVWKELVRQYGCTAAMYTTHKHTPEKPRIRLVIPLDRPVDPDEYQAIARKVADHLGMDDFDDTTYQPQRLMYWPSVASDGQYIMDSNRGEWLSADAILAEYTDWRDITAWPTSSRTDKITERALKKQKDPLEKPGLVGAFCRAYDIHAAIAEFVPDYTPSGMTEGRYTYAKGSTADGVITYDDKFSYSHHATDPTSMQLCNAFDLVRLHRFAELDEDAKEGTPSNRLPSVLAMLDFAAQDKATAMLINAENAAAAADDFEDETLNEQREEDAKAEAEADLEKLAGLERDRTGKCLNNSHNVELILKHDPHLKRRVRLNEMDRDLHVTAERLLDRRIDRLDTAMRDIDFVNIRSYFDRVYGIRSKDLIRDSVAKIANINKYHPIKEYLEGLTWDGAPRVETMLVYWLGASDTPYTREVTKRTLIGAIARIYQPGCKFDNVLTIKGDQGIGKSTIWDKLAGVWFNDSIKNFKGKEAYELLQGSWIVELGELSAMKKAESEEVKSFLSKRVDRYRRAYGEKAENYYRQCIFVGTTNETDFLRDRTGNRRFWIVPIKKGQEGERNPMDMTQEDIDQIWAEAKLMYDKEGLRDLSAAIKQEAAKIQEDFAEEDPDRAQIEMYLDVLLPDGFYDLDREDRRCYIIEAMEGRTYKGLEGKTPRSFISAPELMYELYGKEYGQYDKYLAGTKMKLVGSLPEWGDDQVRRRVNGYGRTRGRERMDLEKADI